MTFRSTTGSDEAVWERAHGWALWKALLRVSSGIARRNGDSFDQDARRVITYILG
jgi:hypothetical protein